MSEGTSWWTDWVSRVVNHFICLYAFLHVGNQCSRMQSEALRKCKGFYIKQNWFHSYSFLARFHPLCSYPVTVMHSEVDVHACSSGLAEDHMYEMWRTRNTGLQILFISDAKLGLDRPLYPLGANCYGFCLRILLTSSFMDISKICCALPVLPLLGYLRSTTKKNGLCNSL